MTQILGKQIGTLDLLDLRAISEFYGRDFLPYPFMITQPSGFVTQEEVDAYVNTVPDRFNHGDLNVFMECVVAYDVADIRVECHVQHIPDDTPSVRVMAYRTGQLGFFTNQRPDLDVIDIYAVSPYDLGAAICDAIALTESGRHPRVVVPEYVPPNQPNFDTGMAVHHRHTSSEPVAIPACNVTAYGTVQSHWRPTRNWGFDRGKSAVVWVRIHGDGEYIYAPDRSHASPMTKEILHDRIDQLIADDIANLREFRRD